MKKGVFALLLLCFMLMQGQAVNADLIVEPEESFLDKHITECEYLGRSFEANGESGHLSVKFEPGSDNEVATVENGEEIFVEYSFQSEDGYWGFTSVFSNEPDGQWRVEGWVRMEQLLVLYDYVSFEEEHSKEFYTYKGNYDEIKNAGSVIAWPWPGAESPVWTIEDLDTESFKVLHAYKDSDGREWGFVTQLRESPNVWVCLSEPLKTDIPAFNPAPTPKEWKPDAAQAEVEAEAVKEVENSGTPMTELIIALVVVLIIGTVLLIRDLYKPDKDNEKKRGGNDND